MAEFVGLDAVREDILPQAGANKLGCRSVALSTKSHVCKFQISRQLRWKLLLGVDELRMDEYLDLVRLGPSVANDKIRNDTFRTLATDIAFRRTVKEDMLVRLLNAFVWHSTSTCSGAESKRVLDFSYVQGMNVLVAPFLYVLTSELEAFECFRRFLENKCPLYVLPTLEGVHKGLKLLDVCLSLIDVELYTHFSNKGLKAEVYALPSILTFSAGTPPLEEAIRLWDFLLAYGVHLNILCIIAQMYLIREELLGHDSPATLLRIFPPLNAELIISLCIQFVSELRQDVYDSLARHVSNRTFTECRGFSFPELTRRLGFTCTSVEALG